MLQAPRLSSVSIRLEFLYVKGEFQPESAFVNNGEQGNRKRRRRRGNPGY
jgi:hypothetical protein